VALREFLPIPYTKNRAGVPDHNRRHAPLAGMVHRNAVLLFFYFNAHGLVAQRIVSRDHTRRYSLGGCRKGLTAHTLTKQLSCLKIF